VAACESAVSSGQSIRSNHSSQQGGGSQNNKIAFHLNISPRLTPIAHICGLTADTSAPAM
jgi:hypothetical protein